jgi:hypothetical protein
MLPQSFGNEGIVSSSSEYDINQKQNLTNFKPVETYTLAFLSKTLE